MKIVAYESLLPNPKSLYIQVFDIESHSNTDSCRCGSHQPIGRAHGVSLATAHVVGDWRLHGEPSRPSVGPGGCVESFRGRNLGSPRWPFHRGLPTVLIVRRLAKNVRQADLWKAALRGCPPWVQPGMIFVGGYAVVNFVLFLAQTSHYPKNDVPLVVAYRGFSGHWMVFYYIGAATLYSAIQLGSAREHHCSRGHVVSPFAKYCEVCGDPLRET